MLHGSENSLTEIGLKCTEKMEEKKKRRTKTMPRPGFEPGLLRPQRNVLTTIRSRLLMPRITRWTWMVKL